MSETLDQEELFVRKSAMKLDFASIGQLILKDLRLNKQATSILKKYKRSDVVGFLDNPSKYEKQLRDISNTLYNKSPQYKRLVQYFADMLLLSYIVEPTGIDYEKVNLKSLSGQYKKTLAFLDLMNIRHEFSKVLTVAFREDIFYGYEHTTNNSYFIQKLNPDFCQISSVEDGCYNFAFDMAYFQANPEKLAMFPPEFKSKYNKYLKDTTLKWQELDATKTVCIKINEDLEYNIPPFASVFESIFDIQDFKDIRKDRTEISNYKVLIQKLPIRKDSDHNNDFMIDYDNMIMFHNKAASILPEQVGLITTPMDVTDVSFNKDSADFDQVGKAIDEMWDAGGVSRLLFNTDKSSSIGLDNSIKTDEMIAFAVLRQVERWINRRLKFLMSNITFRVNMLDITIFNQQTVFDNALKGAQFGLSTKIMAGVALGLSPSSLVNMAILENEILKLPEKLIPLSSAHTANADGSQGSPQGGGNGAPKKADGNISAEGLKSRDGQKGK